MIGNCLLEQNKKDINEIKYFQKSKYLNPEKSNIDKISQNKTILLQFLKIVTFTAYPC